MLFPGFGRAHRLPKCFGWGLPVVWPGSLRGHWGMGPLFSTVNQGWRCRYMIFSVNLFQFWQRWQRWFCTAWKNWGAVESLFIYIYILTKNKYVHIYLNSYIPNSYRCPFWYCSALGDMSWDNIRTMPRTWRSAASTACAQTKGRQLSPFVVAMNPMTSCQKILRQKLPILHVYIFIYTDTNIFTYIHTYIRAYIPTYIHTYIDA